MTAKKQPKKHYYVWLIVLCSMLILSNIFIIFNYLHSDEKNGTNSSSSTRLDHNLTDSKATSLTNLSTSQNVNSLKANVMHFSPYVMLFMLIVTALGILVQTREELDKARQIKSIIDRRKGLKEEHDNFISLISHYLNTPISMMQGGVDLITTLQRAPREITDNLQASLMVLSQKIKSLLTSAAFVPSSRVDEDKLSTALKPYQPLLIMIPIVTVGISTTLINWLIGRAGIVDLSIINIMTQIMAFMLLLYALFSTFKYHQMTKRDLAVAQISLDQDIAMASARLHFLNEVVNNIKTEVSGLRKNLPGLTAGPNAKAIKDGYARLQSILARLQLLTKIEQNQYHGKITSFYLNRMVNNVLSKYYLQIIAHKVSVNVDIPKTLALRQDRQILELVTGSLIDNAIRFSSKHEPKIDITASIVNGRIILAITDNGVGIENDKMDQLFKPFSRAETALRFNYEGLGLSLYLDKIILTKLGGKIVISSQKGQGTQIQITLNPL